MNPLCPASFEFKVAGTDHGNVIISGCLNEPKHEYLVTDGSSLITYDLDSNMEYNKRNFGFSTHFAIVGCCAVQNVYWCVLNSTSIRVFKPSLDTLIEFRAHTRRIKVAVWMESKNTLLLGSPDGAINGWVLDIKRNEQASPPRIEVSEKSLFKMLPRNDDDACGSLVPMHKSGKFLQSSRNELILRCAKTGEVESSLGNIIEENELIVCMSVLEFEDGNVTLVVGSSHGEVFVFRLSAVMRRAYPLHHWEAHCKAVNSITIDVARADMIGANVEIITTGDDRCVRHWHTDASDNQLLDQASGTVLEENVPDFPVTPFVQSAVYSVSDRSLGSKQRRSLCTYCVVVTGNTVIFFQLHNYVKLFGLCSTKVTSIQQADMPIDEWPKMQLISLTENSDFMVTDTEAGLLSIQSIDSRKQPVAFVEGEEDNYAEFGAIGDISVFLWSRHIPSWVVLGWTNCAIDLLNPLTGKLEQTSGHPWLLSPITSLEVFDMYDTVTASTVIRIASGLADGNISIWGVHPVKHIKTFRAGEVAVTKLIHAPQLNNRLISVGSSDGLYTIWNLDASFSKHEAFQTGTYSEFGGGSISCSVLLERGPHRDMDVIVAGFERGMIEFVKVPHKGHPIIGVKPIAVRHEHESRVSAIAQVPGGLLLCSSGTGRKAILWDAVHFTKLKTMFFTVSVNDLVVSDYRPETQEADVLLAVQSHINKVKAVSNKEHQDIARAEKVLTKMEQMLARQRVPRKYLTPAELAERMQFKKMRKESKGDWTTSEMVQRSIEEHTRVKGAKVAEIVERRSYLQDMHGINFISNTIHDEINLVLTKRVACDGAPLEYQDRTTIAFVDPRKAIVGPEPSMSMVELDGMLDTVHMKPGLRGDGEDPDVVYLGSDALSAPQIRMPIPFGSNCRGGSLTSSRTSINNRQSKRVSGKVNLTVDTESNFSGIRSPGSSVGSHPATPHSALSRKRGTHSKSKRKPLPARRLTVEDSHSILNALSEKGVQPEESFVSDGPTVIDEVLHEKSASLLIPESNYNSPSFQDGDHDHYYEPDTNEDSPLNYNQSLIGRNLSPGRFRRRERSTFADTMRGRRSMSPMLMGTWKEVNDYATDNRRNPAKSSPVKKPFETSSAASLPSFFQSTCEVTETRHRMDLSLEDTALPLSMVQHRTRGGEAPQAPASNVFPRAKYLEKYLEKEERLRKGIEQRQVVVKEMERQEREQRAQREARQRKEKELLLSRHDDAQGKMDPWRALHEYNNPGEAYALGSWNSFPVTKNSAVPVFTKSPSNAPISVYNSVYGKSVANDMLPVVPETDRRLNPLRNTLDLVMETKRERIHSSLSDTEYLKLKKKRKHRFVRVS